MEFLTNKTVDDVLGRVIRLYGYPGQFMASRPDWPHHRGPYRVGEFYATPLGKSEFCGFTMFCYSVVEIDGIPQPLRSCPIAMPAADYPHTPMFDYDDGPQENAREILAKWSNIMSESSVLS